MEPVVSILERKKNYYQFLEKGRKVKDWYLSNGFIKTTFGWMHNDWIDEAFKQQWISGDDPMTYKLVVDDETCPVYGKRGRKTEVIDEKKKPVVIKNINGVGYLPRPHAFFKFLENRKENYKSIINLYLSTKTG